MNEVIARVVIDSPLPHLAKPFDYVVPAALEPVVEVGSRVRVPFSGRLMNAVVVEKGGGSEFESLRDIKSSGHLPTFDAASIGLAQEIATRYGGSVWDVLRLMAPARVASVEKQPWGSRGRHDVEPHEPAIASLIDSASRAGLLTAKRITWAAPPTGDATATPARELLGLAIRSLSGGGSAIIVLPDARSLARVVATATEAGLVRWGPKGGHFVVLDADAGAASRYSGYLAAKLGLAPLVFGTRSASLQPVPRLVSMALWDEGASAHLEPRSPYPHARTVAALRARRDGAGLLIGGFALTADAVALADHGFTTPLVMQPSRESLPRFEVIDDESRQKEGSSRHWMPTRAWTPLIAAARESVGALLVPQAGYALALRCAKCAQWAECRSCGGDLAASGPAEVPVCRECSLPQKDWHCHECRASRFVPQGLGIERIALQLARMAPDVNLTVSSSGTGIALDGDVASGLVVATPAALPAVTGGYGHLVIASPRVSWGQGLGAEVAALRRWLNAAALVRPRAEGGGVTIIGSPPEALRTSLITWDGWDPGLADLRQRVELGLPPHRRSLRLEGSDDAIDEAASAIGSAAVVADVSRSDGGAWVLASRSAMQVVVEAVRTAAIRRSQAGLSPLSMRVDATP